MRRMLGNAADPSSSIEISDESPNSDDIRPQSGFNLRRHVSVHHEEINEYYDLKYVIGDGSNGQVGKVIEKSTGIERAMKSIHRDVLGQNIEPDINEVNILEELDHPNIIRIYDIFVSRRKYHIIMELITGGDLHDFMMEHSQLSEQNISKLMFDILSGVSYCHSKGVIHMDISPKNIMIQDVESDATFKIKNFYSAGNIFSQNKPRMFMGNTLYKAPEVFDGTISAKADVGSCGVLLYWLLSQGTYPFNGLNNDMTRNIIKHEELIFPAENGNWVTDGAKDLIRQMLTKDPDRRVSAIEAFNHEGVQGYSNIPQI